MSIRPRPAHRARHRFRPDLALLLVRRHREAVRQRAEARLVALIWLSVAVVVVLFRAAGGFARLGTGPGALAAVANLAALVGTDLALVMLALAARVPLVDRVVGHDRAIALHRRLAPAAFLLIVAHVALVVVALSVRDSRSFLWHALAVMSPAALWAAVVSMILLLAVFTTSWTVVRRRLPFEVWHATHFLTYAFVIVAVPHELGSANVLRPGSPEADYWLALHAIALGLVLVFRFVVPLARSARHRLRVAGMDVVGADAFTVILSGRRLGELAVQGGQYGVWRFWHRSTWWHAHPIAFSAAPAADAVSITIRVAGSGTRRISQVPIGTPVTFAGPYGRMTEASRTAPRLAAIGAGIGITPLKALLEHSELRPGEGRLLLRGTSADEAYLWEELLELARRQQVEVQRMLGRQVAGTWMSKEARGRRTTLLELFPDLLESDLYVCGPPAWAELVVRDAVRSGLPEGQLHMPV